MGVVEEVSRQVEEVCRQVEVGELRLLFDRKLQRSVEQPSRSF